MLLIVYAGGHNISHDCFENVPKFMVFDRFLKYHKFHGPCYTGIIPTLFVYREVTAIIHT